MNKLLLATLLLVSSLIPAAASANVILIDFGFSNNTTSGNFNNVASDGTMTDGVANIPSLSNLVATDGTQTGIGLTVTGFHRSPNANGVGTVVGNFPASATADSLYGNTSEWQTTTNPEITLTFTNIDPNASLSFTMFASRTGAGDVRTTLYSFDGSNSGSDVLDAANNTENFAVVAGITPTAEGTITMTMTKDVTNTNGTGFFYLNAMEITVTPVPEPSTYALIGGVAILGFAIVRRRTKGAPAVAA